MMAQRGDYYLWRQSLRLGSCFQDSLGCGRLSGLQYNIE